MRSLRPLYALPLTLVLAGCGSDDPAKKEPPPELDFSAFDAKVTEYLTANNLEGAGAVIVHKEWGMVHLSGYGAFPSDRIYLIASSSKELTVGVLMRLADQGKLDVDAPIGNYLSGWGPAPQNFDPPKSDLTVAQLVSNSSGLPGLLDNPLYQPYGCQYDYTSVLSTCATQIYTTPDDVPADPTQLGRIPPDTQFRYGGGQWQLSGGIAEAVGGKGWPALVSEMYGDLCGATSIGYTNQFTKAFLTGGGLAGALSYPTFFEGNLANLDPTENPNMEGGAYTTVEDYGKILLMHLRGGMCGSTRVLSEAAVARTQEDRIASYGGVGIGGAFEGYGMGWWVDRVNTGNVADPGAYGAIPWIDNSREYAAFIALEAGAGNGMVLMSQAKPLVDAVFDGVPQ